MAETQVIKVVKCYERLCSEDSRHRDVGPEFSQETRVFCKYSQILFAENKQLFF